jgi:hypothetical protein
MHALPWLILAAQVAAALWCLAVCPARQDIGNVRPQLWRRRQ